MIIIREPSKKKISLHYRFFLTPLSSIHPSLVYHSLFLISLLHSSFSGLSLPLPYPSHPFILLCIIPYLSHYSFSRPQAQQRSERPQSAQSHLGNCRRPLPRSAGYYGRLQRGGGCQQYPPASTIPLAL